MRISVAAFLGAPSAEFWRAYTTPEDTPAMECSLIGLEHAMRGKPIDLIVRTQAHPTSDVAQ